MNLFQAYNVFLVDKETSCSDETIVFYRDNVLQFLKFLVLDSSCELEELDYSFISKSVVSSYIRFLRNKGKVRGTAGMSDVKLKSTSVNTYIRAVKVFLNWSIEQEFLEENFFKGVKLPRADEDTIIPLYNSEVETIDTLFSGDNETSLRNLSIVHLMLDAGLRSSEVVSLDMSDLMFDKNIIRVKGKGNKYRVVPMCPRLKLILYKYCVYFRSYASGSGEYQNQRCFVQLKDRKPINQNCIKLLFTRLKKKTGITRIHAHLCRHTFATSYIMGGGNMEMLRILLGHYDYTVTRKYLHLANQFSMVGDEIYKLDSVFFKTVY